jgi:HPt (histidine-containing phosphotransfer) domain-containing protein
MARARAESNAQITQLNNRVSNWESKYKELETMFRDEIKAEKEEVAAAKAETVRVQERANNTDARRLRQIAHLRAKAAIEVKFRGKGCRTTREYIRRPGTRFQDAVEELCKNVQGHYESMQFFTSDNEWAFLNHKDWANAPSIRKLVPRMKTLEEVCS